MRETVVFLHVAGAFLFVLAHGASMLVAFRLRAERRPERVAALFDLSSAAIGVMYVGLAVLLIAGIAAGFIGGHWGRGWIWASLAILVLVAVAMYAMATGYYARLRVAVGADVPDQLRARYDPPPGPEELDGLASSNRPFVLAGIGGTGLLVILWLMLFKPF
jgi:small-conductance mechanosensitive channel